MLRVNAALLSEAGKLRLRKATLLARAGAKLHVVAPKLDDEMAFFVQAKARLFARLSFSLAASLRQRLSLRQPIPSM